jgi:Tfp pilus assembly protein PilZ
MKKLFKKHGWIAMKDATHFKSFMKIMPDGAYFVAAENVCPLREEDELILGFYKNGKPLNEPKFVAWPQLLETTEQYAQLCESKYGDQYESQNNQEDHLSEV